MTVPHKRLLALALGMTLLAALLVLSSLKVVREPAAKKPVVLQNVQIYVPPTPPATPEPVKSSNHAGSVAALKVQITQKQVQLGLMQLDTRFTSAQGVPTGAGLAGFGTGNGLGAEGFGGEIQVLQINDLDSTPIVMSAPLFVYPDQFKRRHITQFVVNFQIYVDEDGRTYPVRVVDSPDPALDTRFLDYASHVVFTPPVRGGKRVKVQYLWPVRFIDNSGLPTAPRTRFR